MGARQLINQNGEARGGSKGETFLNEGTTKVWNVFTTVRQITQLQGAVASRYRNRQLLQTPWLHRRPLPRSVWGYCDMRMRIVRAR